MRWCWREVYVTDRISGTWEDADGDTVTTVTNQVFWFSGLEIGPFRIGVERLLSGEL